MAAPSLKVSTTQLFNTTASASLSSLNTGVGDYVIVTAIGAKSTGIVSISAVTDTIGNVYSRAGTIVAYLTNTGFWELWFTPTSVASANAANVITVRYAGTTGVDSCVLSGQIWSWGGATTLSFEAETVARSQTGTSITSLAVSTSAVDSLVIGAFDWATNSGQYGVATGTNLIGTANGAYAVYTQAPTPGTYTVGLSGGPTGLLYISMAKALQTNGTASAATVPRYTLPLLGTGR